MGSLKRLSIGILFFMIVLHLPSTAHAEFVRVSDLGLERFLDVCNTVMTRTGNERIGMVSTPLSDDLYDVYFCGAGGQGSGVVLACFVNKEGYVSKLKIISKKQNSTIQLTSKVLISCLYAIGIRQQSEIQEIFKEGDPIGSCWIPNIQRRIIGKVSMMGTSPEVYGIFEIYAYDR